MVCYHHRVWQVAVKGLGHFHSGWEHLTVSVWPVVLLDGRGGAENQGQVLKQSTSTTFLSSWTSVFLGSGALNLEAAIARKAQRFPEVG